MDFDFTDEEGNGTTVEIYHLYGILLTNADRDNHAGNWLTPIEARAIAEALTTAANHVEEAN